MPYNSTARVAAPGSPCGALRGAIRSRPAAWIWFPMPRNVRATGMPRSRRRFQRMKVIRVRSRSLRGIVHRQNPRSIRERAQGTVDRNALVDCGCAVSAGDCRVVAHLQTTAAHPHQAQSCCYKPSFSLRLRNVGCFFADSFAGLCKTSAECGHARRRRGTLDCD